MKWFDLLWNLLVSAPILILAVSLAVRWLKASGAPLRRAALPPPERQEGREAGAGETAAVFGGAMLFRLLVFLAVCAVALVMLGVRDGRGLLSLWEKWDGFHYVRLVEQGYGGYTEDGQHYFLVFYPLYVWLVRLVRLAVGDTVLSGLLVSFFCYAGGCAYLYRLAFREYGRAVAWRTVVFLSVFPFSFFFGAMMTEGLFLLTTAAGLYHIRRHQWLRAGVWGALAALTRMHGLVLIGAALAELIQSRRLFALRGAELKRNLRAVLCRLPLIFLPVLGTVAYLCLNYAIDGNPFAFTAHQQARWSQGFMWISQVLQYLLINAITYGNLTVQLQLWLPEVLLFLLFFALLWHERGRHRSMFTLYAFACLVLNYSLSWLLSAGRYLTCALPFFMFAACLTERRPRLTAVLTAGMSALFILAQAIYLVGGQIM